MVLYVDFIVTRPSAQHLLTPFIVGMLSLLRRLRAGTLSKYTRAMARKCTDIVMFSSFPSPPFTSFPRTFVRSFVRSLARAHSFSLTLLRRGTVHLPVSYGRTYVMPFFPPYRCFFSSRSLERGEKTDIMPDKTDFPEIRTIAGGLSLSFSAILGFATLM